MPLTAASADAPESTTAGANWSPSQRALVDAASGLPHPAKATSDAATPIEAHR
jgi:hypothetical protein